MWETLNNFEIKKEGAQLQYLIYYVQFWLDSEE